MYRCTCAAKAALAGAQERKDRPLLPVAIGKRTVSRLGARAALVLNGLSDCGQARVCLTRKRRAGTRRGERRRCGGREGVTEPRAASWSPSPGNRCLNFLGPALARRVVRVYCSTSALCTLLQRLVRTPGRIFLPSPRAEVTARGASVDDRPFVLGKMKSAKATETKPDIFRYRTSVFSRR